MTYLLPVFATFPYLTKAAAKTEQDKNLQGWLYAIKAGGTATLADGTRVPATEWFCRSFRPDSRDRPFLSRQRTMVPVPSSGVTPLPPVRATWPCFDLAARLVAHGWARDARAVVRRATAVPSSREARAAGEQPPTVAELIISLAVDRQALVGVDSITLVDDVVSAGRNGMAALVSLRRAGFRGDVALMTVAHTNYTSGAHAPYYGTIIWPEGRDSSFRRSWREENPGVPEPVPGPWDGGGVEEEPPPF